MNDACFMTIAEAADAMRAGRFSATEFARMHLDRIEKLDPTLNSFVCIDRARVLAAAARADRQLREEPDGRPLIGIPVAIKDIVDVEGLPTSCNSRISPREAATSSAVAVVRLESAGAVVLGKTVLHEFATGGPGFDLPFPPARNPWDRAKHPGGSSSGSASAVAAGLAVAALGTDTAGSVRHPATACGIVGLKPTYDLVPRTGVFPLSFSLDHVGPMARTVADCAILLDALADRRGAESYSDELGAPISGLKIGVLDGVHAEGGPADPAVLSGFECALEALRRTGARLMPVSLPPFAAFQSCLRIIQQGESYAIHRQWLDERPGDYGAMSREKLAAGALVGAADFVVAQQARRELTARYRIATRGLDAVIVLSSFYRPCQVDDENALAATYDRSARGIFNVTGDPAIAVPVGFSSDGMPLGIQLAAPPYRESRLLRIAHALETEIGATDLHPASFVDSRVDPALERTDGRD